MTHEERQRGIEAIEASNKRMKRDKKYRIAELAKLGIVTPRGNLTKAWKEWRKWYLENSVPIRPGQD